ncbi:MAG: hypothetical protein IMZ61_04765 [Planctomycetes bacterium]|nr:hypothetical protein [Planctomycetota bacterium]
MIKHSIFFILLALLLSGCGTSTMLVTPTADATQIFANALLTATYAIRAPTATVTPLPPTATPVPPTPTPTRMRTPPALPGPYISPVLNKLDTPHSYISDTCQYLKMKWDPNNSAPGTVVMPIMFHQIAADESVLADPSNGIHYSDLKRLLTHAKETGFETITTAQLVDFLYHNAKIPQHSLFLIQDDRYSGNFNAWYQPELGQYNWTITWGWPIGDTDQRAAGDKKYTTLWDQMEGYFATGMLDIQSHGFIHNINIGPNSTDDFIRHEMVDSRNVLRQHFYCKDPKSKLPISDCKSDQPLAYIWPGGGFAKRAVEIGRTAGYKVGFTVNPRGPVMFNWIPQEDNLDPQRPYQIPEGPTGDPLMTLPRYVSVDAAYRIDDVLDISGAAAKYAEQNKATELEYYDILCTGITGSIPTPKP